MYYVTSSIYGDGNNNAEDEHPAACLALYCWCNKQVLNSASSSHTVHFWWYEQRQSYRKHLMFVVLQRIVTYKKTPYSMDSFRLIPCLQSKIPSQGQVLPFHLKVNCIFFQEEFFLGD